MRVEFVSCINHEAKIALIASIVGSNGETSGRKLSLIVSSFCLC